MLDYRLFALLDEMLKIPRLTFWELGNIFELPVEQVKKDILTIQKVLLNNQIGGLVIDDNGYRINQTELDVSKLLEKQHIYNQLVLKEEERLFLIYLYTFSREEILSNFHYQYLLQVSKNTIISDIKKVNRKINQANIEIRYTRSKGYHLRGAELDKRKCALTCVGEILNLSTGSWLLQYLLKDKSADMEANAKIIQQEVLVYGFKVVSDRFETMIYFINLLMVRLRRVTHLIEDDLVISSYPERVVNITENIIKKIYKLDYPLAEENYLVSLFLGVLEGDHKDLDLLFSELTTKIIEKMEAVAVMRFNNYQKLFNDLYAHLVPAYYRLVFGNLIQNDLTDYIKYTHFTLFELVREALTPLAELTNMPIPDEELAYFVAHFGGQIENKSETARKIKALIICPNGISSSLILKQELKQLFPDFSWLEHRSLAEFEQVDESEFDLIFSTIYIGSSKPVYVVKPIMDGLFKQYLIQKVSKDFHLIGLQQIELSDVMATIERYATVHDREKLKEALLLKLLPENKYEDVNTPVLKDVITENRIQIIENEANMSWQEAICLSGAPLLEEGAIEPSYLEAIIKKVTELGVFIDLGAGIAIPHARPEDGVKKLGMSILKLTNPVELLNNPEHQVSILICIAAIDNVTHLKALSQLTNILMDETKLARLKNAITATDIMNLIHEGEE